MRNYPFPIQVVVYLGIIAFCIEIAEAFFGFGGVNVLP